MADLEGTAQIEIDAPIERCWEVIADVERAPEWQGAMKSAKAVERDADGRPALVETKIDALVASVNVFLRFEYDEPTGMRWTRERGDLKSLVGSWELEDLGDGRTRAAYGLRSDPGRVLGMLLRGPVEDKVRDFLLGGAAEGLKEKAEG